MISKILLFSILFLIFHAFFLGLSSWIYQIYNQDAAAVGMGNAFTAIADNLLRFFTTLPVLIN